jgi:hypothetical protein
MANGYKDLSNLINVLDDSEKKTVTTSTFTRGVDPLLLTLNENYIVNIAGVVLTLPGAWKKVILSYQLNTEKKNLTFRYRGSSFKCRTSWETYLTPGVWSVREAVLVDSNGAYQRLDSTYFSSSDDITLS